MNTKQNIYEFFKNEKANKDYNNEIVKKTWYYYNKYGFEIDKDKKTQEFWNNEADAFKHTFMSADLYFKYGDKWSTAAGIYHEHDVPNDFEEWNMDSWNNDQGRQIAKEMEEEYGSKLKQMSQKQIDDIIAEKIMQRMRSGQLITHLNDKRLYKWGIESWVRKHPEFTNNRIKNFSKIVESVEGAFTKANEMSENMKRIIKEYEEETEKSFIKSLEKLNIKSNTPIEEYEKLTLKDRVFHKGDIPPIGKMKSEDITEQDIEEYKAFLNQYDGGRNKIPTKEELDERVARGELIWVDGYTKQDGTVVRGYYRHYPETT